MAEILSEASLALIDTPVIAHVATIDSKGRPQVTPVWVDHDGNDIVINTSRGRAKANHIEKDPSVALSIVSPEDTHVVVALQGKVTEITTEGAKDHIDFLAHKYLGVDKYPYLSDGEVRIKVRIVPERILMQLA